MKPILLFGRTRRTFRKLCNESKGIAAMEFALIAPVLAIIAILISDVSTAAVQATNMETAVRASIQYAMNGGSDMTVAKSVGTSSWSSPPADGAMKVAEYCTCGSSNGTCGQVCSDGSVPKVFVKATAVGTIGGSIISFAKTTTQTVQVY